MFGWFKKKQVPFILAKKRDPQENMGRLVRVGFPTTPFNGLKIIKNKPSHVPTNYYWYRTDVYAPVEAFSYNPAKTVTFAYGLVVNEKHEPYGWGTEDTKEYTRVYFPRLLKSGSRCMLDIPTKYVVYYLEDPENMYRYIPEFARLFCSDNFKMIEFLTERKNLCVGATDTDLP